MSAHPVVERRRRERADLLARADEYAKSLTARLTVSAVVVFGSVARGDFNTWSDIDVLVISDDLPPGGRARLALLHDPAFVGIQPVGWTNAQFRDRLRRGDPIAAEAVTGGVIVHGQLPNHGVRESR